MYLESPLKFGIDAANFGDYSDPSTMSDMAYEAEEAGWDGFFVFDHILPPDVGMELHDPWVVLAAIAMRTTTMRIGPMVTPVPRRRPWKLARETVSLDHLSGGRLTLSVGIGGPSEREFESFGETLDARLRGDMLDEGLQVLEGLWSGESFSYEGRHYRLKDVEFAPQPVQSPRIPMWVGAKWRNKKPLRRAARWDGVFPIPHGVETITPENLRTVVDYVSEHRESDADFDVVLADHDGSRSPVSLVAYERAGLTWWVQRIHSPWARSLDEARALIRQGPPAL
jgi:alkanesulfonate monooxygenase SsuD/methylene tetrahydromethanopterin reductase-like flavin-dependent oxidoreductase (luciferase family)